jgi:hypothetical protein
MRGLHQAPRARSPRPGGCSGRGDPARRPFQLLVDLGTDIGSRDWLRGAATCRFLCYAATQFWPDMSAVDAPVPAPLTDTQFEEARALAIALCSRWAAAPAAGWRRPTRSSRWSTPPSARSSTCASTSPPPAISPEP